jgi:hypothetical protein
LGRRDVPTGEISVHPEKTAFPFPNGSGSYYDKLEAHLFEPLYAIERVWDREGIVNSVRLVIFIDFTLEGRSSQCRAGGASETTIQQSPWVTPNRGSVDGSAWAVSERGSTYAPVIVICGWALTRGEQRYQHYLQRKLDKSILVPYVSL